MCKIVLRKPFERLYSIGPGFSGIKVLDSKIGQMFLKPTDIKNFLIEALSEADRRAGKLRQNRLRAVWKKSLTNLL